MSQLATACCKGFICTPPRVADDELQKRGDVSAGGAIKGALTQETPITFRWVDFALLGG